MNVKELRVVVCFLLFVFTTPAYPYWPTNVFGTAMNAADRYRRTELYFGLSKKDGSEVTDDEWQKFLNDEVTPRFPDGFTVLNSVGQFRMSTGMIVRERSRVLILLYPRKDRGTISGRIDEIRSAYCRTFDQESVLRMDLEKSVSVKFGL